MRVHLLLLTGLVGALALAGCGASTPTTPAVTPTAANVNATFAAPGGVAATYDAALVPAGATAAVTSSESGGSTTVTLNVTGLVPNRPYGAHGHVNPCGMDGMAAGPHYQFMKDPVTPSVDPAFANPQNEIWLDFTTDAAGAGTATATVPWTFPADRRAEAVIIHEKPTSSEPGKAGTAGTRPACVTVDF
ncbi:MAG: superoxide dismutase [Pseudonocardia sp.]